MGDLRRGSWVIAAALAFVLFLPALAPGASARPRLSVKVTGGGTVKGAGISCPPTCRKAYPRGQRVVLTATARPQFAFKRWTGACATSRGSRCTVKMNGAKTVGAVFDALPPPPPPPPIAQAGHYAGTTGRGTAVSFDVTSDGLAITNITFGFSIPCTPSGTLSNPGATILPGTRFGLHADGAFTPLTNVSVTLSGNVTGRLTFSFVGRITGPGSAAGTLGLQASITSPAALECGPVSDTWTASIR